MTLVRCFGDEYCETLPPKIQIVLNPNQNWELGPEPTLGTGEEDEIIQIDTDAIPREISRTNNDPKNEIETKGATGGLPNIRKSSSNQNDQEDFLNSEDESSDDETGNPLKEDNEARKLREKDDVEELTERRSNDLKKTNRESC